MTVHSPPGESLVCDKCVWTMGCVLHCTEHFSQCKVHYPNMGGETKVFKICSFDLSTKIDCPT